MRELLGEILILGLLLVAIIGGLAEVARFVFH